MNIIVELHDLYSVVDLKSCALTCTQDITSTLLTSSITAV